MTDTAHSNRRSTGDSPNTPLEYIDRATLTPLVQQALHSETVEVTSWVTRQIHAGWAFGNPSGSAILRVSGHGRDQGSALRWSLILKVLYPPADRSEPSDFNYWRREADAYQSGFLDDLPGGLAAPRCFDVVEHPDETCWIWMEEIKDAFGPQWPVEHYGVVARHLGQFNGAYLTGHPLPSWPWVGSGWFRGAVASAAPAIRQLHEAQEHPIVRRAYPPDVCEAIFQLWADRELFLGALDRLPRTLCHFDAFRGNLLTRHTVDKREETVAIDWTSVGTGAVGEDVVSLMRHAVNSPHVERHEALKLEQTVLGGYLSGLSDAGWEGDPQQARLGYAAHAAIRDLSTLGHVLPGFLDEGRYAQIEETSGLSIGEVADGLAEYLRHRPLDWLAEARQLLGLD